MFDKIDFEISKNCPKLELVFSFDPEQTFGLVKAQDVKMDRTTGMAYARYEKYIVTMSTRAGQKIREEGENVLKLNSHTIKMLIYLRT